MDPPFEKLNNQGNSDPSKKNLIRNIDVRRRKRCNTRFLQRSIKNKEIILTDRNSHTVTSSIAVSIFKIKE